MTAQQQLPGVPAIEDTLSGAQLAKLLNLTAARVSQLTAENVLHKTETGYPISNVTSYFQFLRAGPASADYQEERTRLITAQADHEELKVKEKEGHLIPAEEVERVWMDKVMAIRSRLLALPSRLAPAAISATSIREVEDFARTEIFQTLNELADDTAPDQNNLTLGDSEHERQTDKLNTTN